jgi:putative sterol carrier protein
VTLLGDAAHVMAPFSGEGVNMAMLDGLDLATQLAATSDWSEAVAGYEERMFERAASAAAGANAAASTWPQQVLDFISESALGRASMQAPSGGAVGRLDSKRTPKELFETRIAEKTRDAATRSEIHAVYRFELSGPKGGTWIVDFKESTPGVRQGDEAGQCMVTMTDDDFVAMLAGELSPRMGFMRGKLKIKGDMSLAMKLGPVLAG